VGVGGTYPLGITMVLPRGGDVRHQNQPFGNTRAYPLGGVILLRFVNIHLLHIIQNLTALPLFPFLKKNYKTHLLLSVFLNVFSLNILKKTKSLGFRVYS